MSDHSTISFDRDRWLRALEEIAIALGKDGDPVEICLIGSAACILGGMAGRSSVDLDVWKPSSRYDTLELKKAVENAGLVFNPVSEIEPDRSYIQIVEPGIVQVGTFDPVLIERMGRLRITRPPIENIIASKLPRCSDKDLEDIAYLRKKYAIAVESVESVVREFTGSAAENAKENLIYLHILQ